MHADHSGRRSAREEGQAASTLLTKARQGTAYANGDPILEVRDLAKHYPLTSGILFKKQVGAVRAVDGVDFDLHAGETLGIVGESGCGKSTVARMLVHLEQPTAGTIRYKGEDISRLSGRALKAVRRNIQMVFQDPYTSLNPRMTVGDIIGEPYEIHPEVAPKGSRRQRVQDLLDVVGLNPEYINRYPHQFSGGQRQRIGIARGLALNPEIIVADEPVSALDVSVQAQVVNLLDRLQAEFSLSFVFIAHDLSIVRHISDRVGVMYLGRIVEIGSDAEIYDHPTHPYTQALLSAVPVPDPEARAHRERIILHGDVPSPANVPSGCRFRTRCWKAQERCELEVPLLAVPAEFRLVDSPARHDSACHFAEEKRVVPPEGELGASGRGPGPDVEEPGTTTRGRPVEEPGASRDGEEPPPEPLGRADTGPLSAPDVEPGPLSEPPPPDLGEPPEPGEPR
ncbi:ABC transporter ATP-binding protein [Streptomyces sp. cmx-18-6]|uniref:ABC transporter ATP-binding protein n=1 Tax=Streptomyces sp. cmx-18-6 TaxID=2790930 RepID=UPI003981342C